MHRGVEMIKVWNKDIKFMGYITNVSSVQWHSKFADYGSFEIHMPLYGVVYDLIEKYNIIQFNNNFGFRHIGFLFFKIIYKCE